MSDLPGGGRSTRRGRRKERTVDDKTEQTRIYAGRNRLRRAWMTIVGGWRDGRVRSSIIAAVLVLLLLGAGAVFVWPQPEPTIPSETRVLDISGQIAGRLAVQNRIEVSLDKMAKDLPNAVVSIEDSRFYRHRGVDFIGIARAAVRDIAARKIVEGGSTLTQQLAKLLYTTGERTITRKLYDAALAVKLEARYTKTEIMAMYLNTAYFGHGVYGAEVASQIYFGKSAADLTLGESALLAAIIRNPEYYSPYHSMAAAKDRRALVLSKMVEQGYISQAQADQAGKETIALVGLKPRGGEAPYFMAYLVDQITQRHPEIAKDLYTGGYEIRTTLDLTMQRAANTAFANGFTNIKTTKDSSGVPQPEGALVAMDPRSGEIRAMIGGRDYGLTQLNRAYQSYRQPGSSFKPFLYSAVIDKGYTPAGTQVCEEVSYPSGAAGGQPYKPADYGSVPYHNAPMTIRRAIAISDNISAVKWASQVGPKAVAQYAHNMGIKSKLDESLPLALGASAVSPLEMCTAYCTLANNGLAVQPLSILQISDRYGNIIEENRPSVSRALEEKTAYTVTYMMTGVLEPGGTGASLANIVGRQAAGKTGTTNDQRDAWFMGFTPELVAAVWIGHDDPSTSLPGTGGVLCGPIWARFMAGALANTPATTFTEPAGLEHASVCQVTGLPPNSSCPVHDDVYLPGTEPGGVCPLFHDASNPYDISKATSDPWAQSPSSLQPGQSPPGTQPPNPFKFGPPSATAPDQGGDESPSTPALSRFIDWLLGRKRKP